MIDLVDGARFTFNGDPAAYARMTNRSWWVLRYTDGTIIREWERDWPLCPRRGRQALRLYCPDGKLAEVGMSRDATDRLFQLKLAARNVGIGRQVARREVLAHLIGGIGGTDGQCTLWAWEPAWPLAAIAPAVLAWLVAATPALGGLDAVARRTGIPLEELDATVRGERPLGGKRIDRLLMLLEPPAGLLAQRRRCAVGRLVGPLDDNANSLAYGGIGRLSNEHLGIRAD